MKKLIENFSLLILFMFVSANAMAQRPDLNGATGEIQNFAGTIIDWVDILLGVACAIGLLFMLYKVFNKEPQSKEFVVSWVIGLVIWVVAFRIAGL